MAVKVTWGEIYSSIITKTKCHQEYYWSSEYITKCTNGHFGTTLLYYQVRISKAIIFFEDLKFESGVPELHDSMMFTIYLAIFKELVIVDYRE